MYKIYSETDGSTLAYVEKPNYIKVGESGSYTPTDADDAQGVAVNGTPYALVGQELDGAEGTVGLIEFDGGASLTEQQAALDGMILTILEG